MLLKYSSGVGARTCYRHELFSSWCINACIARRQAYELYLKQGKFPDAMRVALRVNDRERIEQCFAATPDPLEKQQLAFLLARQV